MTEYSVVKLVHLGALVFWLGPALGAWIVLKATENKVKDNRALSSHPLFKEINRIFYLMVAVEHLAFAALLISGFYMAYLYQWFHHDWLVQKLWVVFLIIVPLEIVDIALGNWLVSNASKKLFNEQKLTKLEEKAVAFYHGVFTQTALILIPSSTVIVMFLAISKQNF